MTGFGAKRPHSNSCREKPGMPARHDTREQISGEPDRQLKNMASTQPSIQPDRLMPPRSAPSSFSPLSLKMDSIFIPQWDPRALLPAETNRREHGGRAARLASTKSKKCCSM